MTARISPGSRRDIGIVNWGIAVLAGRVTRTSPPALFLILGRHRKLFRGWLRFAARLMPGGLLARRETELVILRVAHTRKCAYEFQHHARLARRAGVREVEVASLTDDAIGADWSLREQAILEATDQLLSCRDIDGSTWDTLSAWLDEREIVELIMLVGHYDMLATTITALRIDPD
jgi:AhpD family alkylhydroperoxidase